MTRRPKLYVVETPTYNRILCGALVAFSLGCWFRVSVAQAEPPAPEGAASPISLAEADVIRLARTRSPAAEARAAEERIAEARASGAGLRANPTISWSRETVETSPSSSQDIVSAEFPLDIFRPQVAQRMGAADAAQARSSAALSLDQTTLDLLLLFNQALEAQQQIQVLEAALTDLKEASRVLQRREQEGTASGYERARLGVAVELLRSRIAEAQGRLGSNQARLAVRLGLDPQRVKLVPSSGLLKASEAAALAKTHGRTRETVKQATRFEEQARQAAARAEWSWVPTLGVVGGIKRVSDLGGGVGYTAGVAVDVPLFDRGQALRAEAEAQRSVAKTQVAALQARLDAEIQGALATFLAAERELSRFQKEVVKPLDTLMVATASGYREGELSLLQLLDAQSTKTAIAERRVRLLATAKEAELRLRSAAGDL